ncbi:MAG: TlyA family RNA methyltransferase [Chloracidobacterium sp.]|nr:TlyA family RNA methyltransferase [Chloracidobacterium sp.]MDW8218174.1 TlyA family RNA methyltransferase [Acidobacteriota bacterium]
MAKRRLDSYLVEAGLAESRQKAQALILAGQVLVNDRPANKPSQPVPPEAVVRLRGETLRYVGRGGVKLEAALQTFAVDVRDAVCLDVGASTGGFTDCLLQHGARRVYAVDVGHNQLAWKLRCDPRVIVHERVNARHLTPEMFPEQFAVATVDVSFISLELILPALHPLLLPEAALILLVKPQFEVGRNEVGKGGIVRDPQLQAKAVARIIIAARRNNFHPLRLTASPILGAAGNREFLLLAQPARPASATDALPADALSADWSRLFPEQNLESLWFGHANVG